MAGEYTVVAKDMRARLFRRARCCQLVAVAMGRLDAHLFGCH